MGVNDSTSIAAANAASQSRAGSSGSLSSTCADDAGP